MSLAAAVEVRLKAWAASQPSLISVYYVQIPGLPPADETEGVGRYVVIYPITNTWTVGGQLGESRDIATTVQVTSVAWFSDGRPTSPAKVTEWLQEQVKAQLVDWLPTIDGMTPGPIGHTRGGDLQPDETVPDRHEVYAADQFSLLADRT